MELFIHLPEHPFVICKWCQVAVVADEVVSHIKSQHTEETSISSKLRQIHNTIQAIPGIIYNQKELKEWSVPPVITDSIPWIPPPKNDGLGCDQCLYVARQTRRINQHYREKHGRVNTRKRGRRTKKSAAAEPIVPWRIGVQC